MNPGEIILYQNPEGKITQKEGGFMVVLYKTARGSDAGGQIGGQIGGQTGGQTGGVMGGLISEE